MKLLQLVADFVGILRNPEFTLSEAAQMELNEAVSAEKRRYDAKIQLRLNARQVYDNPSPKPMKIRIRRFSEESILISDISEVSEGSMSVTVQ